MLLNIACEHLIFWMVPVVCFFGWFCASSSALQRYYLAALHFISTPYSFSFFLFFTIFQCFRFVLHCSPSNISHPDRILEKTISTPIHTQQQQNTKQTITLRGCGSSEGHYKNESPLPFLLFRQLFLSLFV